MSTYSTLLNNSPLTVGVLVRDSRTYIYRTLSIFRGTLVLMTTTFTFGVDLGTKYPLLRDLLTVVETTHRISQETHNDDLRESKVPPSVDSSPQTLCHPTPPPSPWEVQNDREEWVRPLGLGSWVTVFYCRCVET